MNKNGDRLSLFLSFFPPFARMEIDENNDDDHPRDDGNCGNDDDDDDDKDGIHDNIGDDHGTTTMIE